MSHSTQVCVLRILSEFEASLCGGFSSGAVLQAGLFVCIVLFPAGRSFSKNHVAAASHTAKYQSKKSEQRWDRPGGGACLHSHTKLLTGTEFNGNTCHLKEACPVQQLRSVSTPTPNLGQKFQGLCIFADKLLQFLRQGCLWRLAAHHKQELISF